MTTHDDSGLPGVSVASNPGASEAELTDIALKFASRHFFDNDRGPLRYYRAAQVAAGHPNTPLRALIKLARTFRLEVSGNPVLELEIAANGITAEHMHYAELYALAPTRNISEALLRYLERHWEEDGKPPFGAACLAQHPDASPEFLHAALGDGRTQKPPEDNPFLNHRNYPGAPSREPYSREDAWRTVFGGNGNHYDAVAHLAQNRLLSVDVADEFIASSQVRRTTRHTAVVACAYHPDMPETFRRNSVLAMSEADLKYFPPETLPSDWGLEGVPKDAVHVMCIDYVHDLAALVALSPDLPDAVIQYLLWDVVPVVRACLALNPTTPRWALEALLDDANTRVQATAQAAVRR